MFESRDYIVRMLKQLNRAIATILKHHQEERYEDALDTVGDTVDELLDRARELATQVALNDLAPSLQSLAVGLGLPG